MEERSLNTLLKNVASSARAKLVDLVLNTLPACQNAHDRAVQLLNYSAEYRSLYLKLMALVEFVG